MNPRAISLLCRVVWLELFRRKDLGIFLLFTAILTLLVLGARAVGVDQPETGTFLLNLGLGWAWTGAHLLTLLLAARQFPQELEQRTLHTLLSRPLDRADLVLAKWLASALGGLAVFGLLLIPGWLAPPHLENYATGTLFQALGAAVFSLALASALAVAASLFLSRALAAVLPVMLLFFSGKIVAAGDAWSSGREGLAALPSRLLAYLPDLSRFNLFTRYTDGLPPASAGEFAGLAAYAAVFSVFLLSAACARFHRLRL